METTMGNNINKNSKVIGALALLLSLSACGQGFKARQSQELSSTDSDIQKLFAANDQKERTPAATSNKKVETPSKTTPPVAANDNEPLKARFVKYSPEAEARILERFKHIDPHHQIDTALLKRALLFFYSNQSNFMNKKVVTVIDYSRPSSEKRLHIVEMSSGRVWSTYVAHGRGSDKNHDGVPEVFNNKFNSNATSIGAFVTMSQYKGENGLSLRLKGLSKYNSNAFERNVVIHGASYVRDSNVKQGRSWGCPAVAPKHISKLITAIKGGSLVYAGASRPSIHRQL